MVSGTPFSCLHPQTVVNPYTGEKLNVPCGKCPACQSRKAARNVTQIQLEARESFAVMFITLTFANSFIPRLKVIPVTEELPYEESFYSACDVESGEVLTNDLMMKSFDLKMLRNKVRLFGDIPYLDKSYAQKFMKRLRKSLSQYSNEKIRYYLCGEYGPVHFRPHFHILLFLESGIFLNKTAKTLKDFPQWTWQNSESPDPNSKLSVIECAVRESWRFGSVDAVLSKGDCAQYVASYVNGFSNLPKIFRLPQTKPFATHSRFLGFKFCKTEREKVYASPVEDVVRRSLSFGSIHKEFNMPLSYTNVFFPRCKGYTVKSARERMFTYRLYLAARKEFPETSLLDVATDIVNSLMLYYNEPYTDKTPKGYPPMMMLLCGYFKKSLRFRYASVDGYSEQEISSYIGSVYRELCLSRHFLTFVCNGDYTIRATNLYYHKIEEFYNFLERMKLSRFYEEQQVYAEKDVCLDDGFVFFYDNIGITDDEIYESVTYKQFQRLSLDHQRKLIKHKYQNDLNAIFNNV